MIVSIRLLNLVERSLDASAMRHKAISNNLANAETPGYQPQRVVFEQTLKEAMNASTSFAGKMTDARHIPIGSQAQLPSPYLMEEKAIVNNDGNGVDVDYEMTALSKNSLWYNALAQQMNHEFNQLKTAIKGRV